MICLTELPGNAVYGVMGDQAGNIWISTEQGLGKPNPITERFENYYREDVIAFQLFPVEVLFPKPLMGPSFTERWMD